MFLIWFESSLLEAELEAQVSQNLDLEIFWVQSLGETKFFSCIWQGIFSEYFIYLQVGNVIQIQQVKYYTNRPICSCIINFSFPTEKMIF